MLRKINRGGVILACLLALVGCQSEKLVDDGGSQGGQVTLTASKGAKGVGSRTALDGNQTIWSEDDAIFVSSKDNGVTGTLYLDPESLSDDKTTATFTGIVIGGDPTKLAYSVFPAPKKGTIIDLSIIEGGGEVDAPFIGKIDTSDDVDVRFEHVCGVAPIVKNNYQGGDIIINAKNNSSAVSFLKELDVTKVDWDEDKPKFIVDNASNKTSTITITSPKGGEMYVPYYITSAPEANNDGKKVVDFMHENDVVNKADLTDGFVGKVHATTVVVYTMDENGKSVENKTTQSTMSEDEKTAVVDKGQFDSINSDETSTSEETQYFNVSGLVEKTEEGKTQNVVAEAVEVTLPKVDISKDNEDVEKSVEISFTNVAPSTTITIQEDESTSGSEQQEKSIDNLTVVLPSGTTAEEAKETVNINMPNTTVTVKSDDGQILLINEMIAATADNTLVIGEDVEITKLTIKKGNVQVWGKVGEIKRDSNNEDKETVLTIEKGGEVKKVDGKDNITVINKNTTGDVDSFEGTVNTFAELQKALTYAGGIITIGSNFEITAPLTNSGEFEINMQGHTLTVAEGLSANVMAVIINNNHLHVYNGTFQANSSDIKYFIHNEQGSCFEIDGVDIMVGGMQGGILNEGITFVTPLKDKTSTIKANGLAINNGGEVYIDHGIIEGNVENFNQGTFEIEQGKITGDLTTSSPEGTITIGEDVVIAGNNWPKPGQGGGDKPDGGDHVAEGTPVTDLKGLQAILGDQDNRTNIILTAPIVLTENYEIDLGGRILFIDENIFANHPDATAAISSTANLTIRNATIYGPKLKETDTQRYMIEHIGSASQITTLSITSVILESRAIEKAVHLKDGYLYLKDSSIQAGIAFYLEADNKTVKAHIDGTSEVSNRIIFTHNHGDETNIDLNMSGIYIDYGARINSSLEVGGTYAKSLELDIKRDESKYYGYDFINGEGWFEATVNYIQHQLATTGLVEISAWNVKNDVAFDVNNQVNDGIIRFYVNSLTGSGTITFNNTNGQEQELYLDVKEGSDKVKYTGSFKVQDLNASSEGE